MQLAMVGLGKMGGNMARRLLRAGHDVVGLNIERDITDQLASEEGLEPAYSLSEAVGKLSAPRVVWLMVPAGPPTEDLVQNLRSLLSAGDTRRPGSTGGQPLPTWASAAAVSRHWR